MKESKIIFDGHNDLLLRLWLEKDNNGTSFFNSSRVKDGKGHLDLKSANSGGFVGGFFAIFLPARKVLSTDKADTNKAKVAANDMIRIAKTMAQENPSKFSIVLDHHDILTAIEKKLHVYCISRVPK